MQQNITKLYTYIKETERKTKQVIKNKIGNTKITEQTRENAVGKRQTTENTREHAKGKRNEKSILDQDINESFAKRNFYRMRAKTKTVHYEVKNGLVEREYIN